MAFAGLLSEGAAESDRSHTSCQSDLWSFHLQLALHAGRAIRSQGALLVIESGWATLNISSREHSVAGISELLGVDSTSEWEKGDRIQRYRGLHLWSERRRVNSHWSVSFDSVDGEDNSCGVPWLAALVERLSGKADVLARLREDYHVDIAWFATIHDGQGSFIFPPELLAGVAALGCELHGYVGYERPSWRDRLVRRISPTNAVTKLRRIKAR
jgi:hypothetical protein